MYSERVEKPTVQQLAKAVQAGDLERTRELLHARPELIHKDLSENNEHRALHFAVLRRDKAMTRLLMQAGANARRGIYPHRDATSALAIAREREYPEIVAIIEEEERNRETVSSAAEETEESTPVEQAIEAGNAALVRELIAADSSLLREIEPSGGLLTFAVQSGQIEMVRLLLDLGADPDERIFLKNLEEPTPSWGMPLWHAARDNSYEIAELLLDRGADPNANVYASGWPLGNAWYHEDGRIRKLLLDRGATRQLYMVVEQHDVEEARRLLEAGLDESQIREMLWSSCDRGCPEILQMALPRIDWPRNDPRWHWIIIQPIRGATADHAGQDGHFACMAALLTAGVDPNVARYGQTALHFAAAYRGSVSDADRARFAGMLIDAGARLDLRDDLLHSTPLGWACRWGRTKLAETLIARGAPRQEPDAEPWATPRAWAKKMGREEILALL